MPNYSLGFVGNGSSSEKNTADLLNDFLADAEGVHLYVPVTQETLNTDLAYVLDWSSEDELPLTVVTTKASMKADDVKSIASEEGVATHVGNSPDQNVVDLLIQAQERNEDDEVYLIAFLGEEPDDDLVDVVTAAFDAGISVLDITAGLDVVDLADEEEQDSEPEPEPEPEPKPARRRGKAAAKELEEKEEELTEDVPETETKPTRRGRSSAKKEENLGDEAQASEEVSVTAQRALDTGAGEVPAANGVVATILDKISEIQNLLFELVEEEKKEEEPATPPKKTRGRPRKDGSPAQPRTEEQKATKEYYDEYDEEWKPLGRGRPPKGARIRLVGAED